MPSKPKEQSATCGECFRKFTGTDAPLALEQHILNAPCPGYADARDIRDFFEALSKMPELEDVVADVSSWHQQEEASIPPKV